MRFLFLVAAFVSSALLFVVEPLAAKIILPTFGGAPQVWNSCLLFFQTVLLFGYFYAHISAQRLRAGRHRLAHILIVGLAALALPISSHSSAFSRIQTWVAADKPPIPLVLLALAILVGLPFFALSANSSTLQRWYAESGRPDSAEPWFLYSAGNLGSMLALISYPLIIEPRLSLRQQGIAWTYGYLGLIALLICCAFVSRRGSSTLEMPQEAVLVPETEGGLPATDVVSDTKDVGPLTRATKLTWLALAAVPSSLLLGVTTYLTSNIAPIPLLWVVPLALYLLTFILVFAKKPIAPAAVLGRIYPLALTPLVLILVTESALPVYGIVHLIVFFIACWMCHSRLALMKPSVEHLTEYYFYISLGGVVGGAFNALVAPVVFDTLAEYPTALVAAAMLIPRAKGATKIGCLDAAYPAGIAGVTIILVFISRLMHLDASPLRTFLTIGIPAILCFLTVDLPTRFGLSIAAVFLMVGGLHVTSDGSLAYTARSFFGVHRIVLQHNGRRHRLFNGNTLHGVQDLDHPTTPLTYYYPNGPIGQVMTEVQPPTAAFVGLGVGSLAAYGHPGQSFTYYEIDPIVRQIALDPKYFTFIRDSRAKVDIVLGDARLELSKTAAKYDLIVLDAFSSDAIPVHLLTEEAIKLYLARLKPNGMLAFHISNRFLDLTPILSAACRDLGLVGMDEEDGTTIEEKDAGKQESHWVVIGPTKASFVKLKKTDWNDLEPTKERAWTDDYSDVIQAFKPEQ